MFVDDAPAHVHNLGERAVTSEGVLVVDTPIAAQAHRIYDDYLDALSRTAHGALGVCAFSMVVPRNRIDKDHQAVVVLPWAGLGRRQYGCSRA